MTGTYEIIYDGKIAGQARVEKQGLYYRFSCRCAAQKDKMVRLQVSCGGKDVDLGLLVPMEGQFGVEKRVPCKQFGAGTPEFHLTDGKRREERKAVNWYPVYPEEPFAHMKRLKDAYLETKNGQMGIVFRKTAGQG